MTFENDNIGRKMMRLKCYRFIDVHVLWYVKTFITSLHTGQRLRNTIWRRRNVESPPFFYPNLSKDVIPTLVKLLNLYHAKTEGIL